jgi:hypothetical protein
MLLQNEKHSKFGEMAVRLDSGRDPRLTGDLPWDLQWGGFEGLFHPLLSMN